MAQDSTSTKETLRALDEYVLLGRSGLRVSPLCLGTMSTGVNYEGSKEIFNSYFEKGGNFIGINLYTIYTANLGESERFIGEFIADKRSQVVIATKYTANATVFTPNVKYNANAGGNHRKSLIENLDASLKRLNTGYIDLLYVHAWEFRTPTEEVMRSLDDVIRSGKVGIIPWGCIAEGFLTGKYTKESDTSIEKIGVRSYSITKSARVEKNWEILNEVKAIASEINKSPTQVVLNWISQKPGVTSPLIGVRTKAQLDDNLKALEFKLTPEQMARLDAVSTPKEIPFPYNFFARTNYYLGKDIQMPEKFKPVLSMSTGM
ncbi:13652_t:CDS:10 [Dentiscutata heterogama]|uniref:13652_t:CDS:1 n=1 Tax=Dentiscutata heterogama TaxID=1316150 RepID=A0ACA9LJN1_9GLOM|nr:13652_t:CDS:10 [Dentiscutata heterogama]